MLIRGLIALAFGTLGLGIAEYVAMGLLPYWAEDFHVTIAQSGHAISAYALGVAIGAFFIILLRTLKLKTILLILILVHIAGNVLTAFAPTFETMLASRFIAGLPHGAYFGVGSIIAQRLAAKGKGTSAVAIMIAGMTVSNIFGVPLGTALAHSMSWRTIFYIVICWGILVLLAALFWIRDVGKIKDTGFKGQFVFLRNPAPWWVLAATMFGNAGIFCMHSYISPILTDFAGIPLAAVSAVMAAETADGGDWLDIVQVNSKSGLQGSNKNGAYAGGKFGGIGLTQSFAMELVADRIKVNSVCPGNFFDGPLWSNPERGLFVQYLNSGKVPGAKTVADVKRFYEAKVPMNRGCYPADVAKAILYAVEQKYETGQAIPVTGGQVMLK